MSRTLFVMNPRAGGGRAAKVRDRLLSKHPDLHTDNWIEGRDTDHARELLRSRVADADVTKVVAIGGDGTAHGVACMLLEEGIAERVAIGLVPAGTGSDFARHLGLPKSPEDALAFALSATPRPIDAIEIQTDSGTRTHCLNIASAGLSGAVDQAVNATTKHSFYLGTTVYLRTTAYLWTTVKAVLGYRPIACRVLVDGELLTNDPFFVVAMANGRFFGQGMQVAPDAVIDDGWLDVILVPPVAKWQLPLRMPQFFAGRHVHLPQVQSMRAKEVRVEPPAGFFPFDLDGETLASEPATFRILPGALRFLG